VGKGRESVSVVKDVAEPLMERLQVLVAALDIVAATWFQLLVVGVLPKVTPNPVEKLEVPLPVHVIPSVLVAMLFVPSPTATQRPL
jgi:ABC-type phosphate/phosphonate transport system permease subunit